MAGEENSTLMPRDEDEGLGAGFFLKIAGVLVAGGIIVFILCLIFWRAVYAWGFFGAFLALAAVLCLFGWLYDRRD
jgi:fatty acid desaturase